MSDEMKPSENAGDLSSTAVEASSVGSRAANDGGEVPSPQRLLEELSRLYKIQPATALWRSVEIAEVLKLGLPEGHGLDLGCGDGALTGLIYRHLKQTPVLTGLDYSAEEIEIAKRRGIYRDTICGKGDAMPIDDATFDFVFSNSVLEHIPALEGTIAETARILKRGGSLIATVPTPTFREFLRARGRSGAAREAYLAKMDARLGHYNYLDEEDWRALLARHGLRLANSASYLSQPQVQRWERLSGLTAGVLQTLGAGNGMLYRLQRLTRSDGRTAGGLLAGEFRPSAWSRLWAKVVAGSALRVEPDQKQGGACLIFRAVKE